MTRQKGPIYTSFGIVFLFGPWERDFALITTSLGRVSGNFPKVSRASRVMSRALTLQFLR